jgi:hypothetical protein
LRRVLASYVVRLVPEELDHGRFVGEVEDVATGVHQAIRDVSELVRFCVQSNPGHAGTGSDETPI